jgi:hypothetical protein
MRYKYLLATLSGIIIAFMAYAVYQFVVLAVATDMTASSESVHVHADFKIYLDDTPLELSNEKYMSSAESTRHPNLHLHDGTPNVLHRHAADLTFAEFVTSLGFSLTNECFTDISVGGGFTYCNDETDELILIVNGKSVADIVSYVPQDADQVLLYAGKKENPRLQEFITTISDEACIYSGTCPERGTPPPEACGLTCEI